MEYTDIQSARQALENRQITLHDLVQRYHSAIQEQNPELNAFTRVELEEAEEQAQQVQEKLDKGTAGKLAGSVFGIKELICQKGQKTTCASGMLKEFESVYDATVIEKLRAEDAVIIGRLNMDEFAMGSSNENSVHGQVQNPVEPGKVPGGSSGGSAAAIAAGLCNATLGSDTGGSVRQPASYCGVVGLKPTYGRVSRHGLVAFASSFDCIGPLTSTVRDAADILSVISGRDRYDATTSDRQVPDYVRAVDEPKTDIRIGVPREYFGEGLDGEISDRINEVLSGLEKEGAQLVDISLPHTEYAVATYYILATAEASSNLARFDGIRYGHRADVQQVKKDLKDEQESLRERIRQAEGQKKADLEEQLETLDSTLVRLYKQSRTEGFGAEVKRRIMVGTYVLSAGYYEAYYGKAQKVRRLIKQDFEKAFQQVDVIASPTAPTTAFDLGANVDDPLQMYLNDIYTISANLAGICGISVPAGQHSNGLPIGIQFMADAFDEANMLNAGRLAEKRVASIT